MLSLLHYKNVTVLCMAEDEAVVICYVAFFYAQGRLAFCFFFFFFNDTAPTEFSTLPLHDALPISWVTSTSCDSSRSASRSRSTRTRRSCGPRPSRGSCSCTAARRGSVPPASHSSSTVTTSSWTRSEEHTSELQSQSNLVCRLLLEK